MFTFTPENMVEFLLGCQPLICMTPITPKNQKEVKTNKFGRNIIIGICTSYGRGQTRWEILLMVLEIFHQGLVGTAEYLEICLEQMVVSGRQWLCLEIVETVKILVCVEWKIHLVCSPDEAVLEKGKEDHLVPGQRKQCPHGYCLTGGSGSSQKKEKLCKC